MKITIIGVGYVGLVTGACLSEFGHQVLCMDQDAEKIARLNDGQMPIYEPGLGELVAKNVKEKHLSLISTPFVVTDPATAELTKYAANAFLATKISFINEMANLCEAVGADVIALAEGMGLDGRIGGKFLHPGPGYGGSCFPKDTTALLRMAQEHGAHSGIDFVLATWAINFLEILKSYPISWSSNAQCVPN